MSTHSKTTNERNGQTHFPTLALSHIELFVTDLTKMEKFYQQRLGFVITDRSEGDQGMVFMSRNSREHHQIVLSPNTRNRHGNSPIDHISFRVQTLTELKTYYQSLCQDDELQIQTVSHGTTWSIYFHDPEGNRFEIFTDTPWHVNQPCKFKINLTLDNDALHHYTEQYIQHLPGFQNLKLWQESHNIAIE